MFLASLLCFLLCSHDSLIKSHSFFCFCFVVDALVLRLKSSRNSSEKSQLALPNTHISYFDSGLAGAKCFLLNACIINFKLPQNT